MPVADRVGRLQDKACALLGTWSSGPATPGIGIGDQQLPTDLLVVAAALEIAVHGWDVGQVVAGGPPLPEELAARLLPVAQALVGPGDRPARFAPDRPAAPRRVVRRAAAGVPRPAGASDPSPAPDGSGPKGKFHPFGSSGASAVPNLAAMLVESSLPTAPEALALAHARFLAQTGKVTRALGDLEAMPEPDHDLVRVSWLATRLDCRLARGDLTAAGALADRLADHAGDDDLVGAFALHGLGEHASARRRRGACAHPLPRRRRPARGAARTTPRACPGAPVRRSPLVRTRRAREADTLAQEHLELARRTGSAYVVAQAMRIVAATESGGSRVACLREARMLLDQVPAERLAAQIDTDLGVLLSLDPDPSAQAEAVALLRGAEDYAGREDLFPLQHRIRENLQRLGQEPRRIRSETLATLTATEQKAARMAAAGLTNREIAESMQVTVKAVEWHLSHVYRKLGIRGRRGLAASLGAAH